jgi:DamX protein
MVETPDEKDLLWPPTWQGLQQQIVYLAQFGNSVQVIHGEAGAGKTTFFNRLLQRDFGQSALGVRAEDKGNIESFFRSILTQLGLRPDVHATRGELIAALRGFVQTLHKERSRTVLLVDDAHALTDSELGALVSLLQGHSDAGVGLHIVMFAEPGFAARVDALEVLDVTVHDAPLPPLSPSEVHSLLLQLEPHLGFTLDSPDQAQRLWHQSRGLPGRLLELAYQLRPAPAVTRALSLRGLPIGHFAALVLLSGVLIWAFLVRDIDESPRTEAKSLPISTLDSSIQASDPANTSPLNPLPPDAIEAAPRQMNTDPPSAPPSTALSQGVTTSNEPALPPEVAGASQSVSAQEPTIAPPGANFDAQTPDTKPIAADTPKSEPAGEEGQAAKSTSSDRVSSSEALAQVSDSWFTSEQELMRMPASGFMLQLMATSSAEALRSNVTQQPNRKNLRMYRGTRDGKTLYIVVEGFYADKAAAQAAIVNLPEHQRKAGPWPKPLDQIQREIRANRAR